MHEDDVKQGPRALLYPLLEADGNRRPGTRISPDLRAGPLFDQELFTDEARLLETAGYETAQGHLGELPHARDAPGPLVSHLLFGGMQGVRDDQRTHEPPDQVAERSQGTAGERTSDRSDFHQ